MIREKFLGDIVLRFRVRKTVRPHVGDLDVAAVACGLGRAIGNKVRRSSRPLTSKW